MAGHLSRLFLRLEHMKFRTATSGVPGVCHLALYRWSLEYGLDRGAWVTSLKHIETWWRERMGRLAGPVEGED